MSKGEDTRKAILDRAAELSSRVGLEGLTIGSLAGELGLSKSGLFAHFRSKEALQVQVIEHVSARFVDRVLRPALREPRGEPRLRALFERVLDWPTLDELPGGCPLLAAVNELDDRPGPARELLVRQQRDWLDSLATVAKTAVAEGHFRADVDPEQVAFEIIGLVFAHHHRARLLGESDARARTKAAFEALVQRSKPQR